MSKFYKEVCKTYTENLPKEAPITKSLQEKIMQAASQGMNCINSYLTTGQVQMLKGMGFTVFYNWTGASTILWEVFSDGDVL